MKKTIKEYIIDYLRYSGRVSGVALEHQADNWFTSAENVRRRARELVNEGKISRSFSEKGTVQYSIRPIPKSLSVNEASNFLETLRKEEVKQGELL